LIVEKNAKWNNNKQELILRQIKMI